MPNSSQLEFTGPLGIALIVAVLALLILREALPSSPQRSLQRRRLALAIVLVPLVVLLVASLSLQLVAIARPVFAAEIAATTAERATATSEPVNTLPITTPAQAVTAPTEPTPIPDEPRTPTPLPTMAPTNAATASAEGGLPQQVATAVNDLRSGQFSIQITYTNTTSSTTALSFNLGDGQRPASLYSFTTYQGVTGKRTTERIVIGERTWTRAEGEAWIGSVTSQPVRKEIATLLPETSGVLGATAAETPNVLRWYDATRDSDNRLETYPQTSLPRLFQQTTRGTTTVLTATYDGWNTPVTITPPTGQ